MVTDADISKIYDRLDAISKDVATISATCPGCREQVRENTRALHGNGTGVQSRLLLLEERLGAIAEAVKSKPVDPAGITFSLRGAAGWQTALKLIAAIGILFGLPALGSYVGQGAAQQPPAEATTDK